jgi:hypothetical protein
MLRNEPEFRPLAPLEPLRQPILGKLSRKSGAGMYNCGVRETITEILVYMLTVLVVSTEDSILYVFA